VNKRIEHYKELLQVLPRNNVKNSREYMKKALIMKKAAVEYKKLLLDEIKRRYYEIIVTGNNEEIKVLEGHLEDMKKNLYLLNPYNDSYEKSGLNKSLYELKKFYNNDLTKVNQDIRIILEEFRTAGITLTAEDFNYGEEVKEYMRMFFIENNPDSTNLKTLFDKLYWKCPDLIQHIYLNFRYLYSSNKKILDKYYEKKLSELNISSKEKYIEEYKNCLRNYLDLKDGNIKIIQDMFLDGKLEIKEYDDQKINKLKESLLVKEMSNEEQDESFLKLSYTLLEYKNYLEFEKVISEIKGVYADKNNKNLTKGITKKIAGAEKKIKKANKKINFRRRFKGEKANIEKFLGIIEANLLELKSLYSEYDFSRFKEKVVTELKDDSTLLDILELASSYEINLAKIFKIDNEEITKEEINEKKAKLNDFISYPNNTIVNNITINDTRDIVTIILDKYKLMNLNVTSEQLEDSNLDSFVATVNKILINNYIARSPLKYDKLSMACEMKKILDKEGILNNEENN